MQHNHNDRIIVHSTIKLAHNLGLEVVAEGIETQDVSMLLNTFGCDRLQGYLIAQPMPAAEIPNWIKQQKSSFQSRSCA